MKSHAGRSEPPVRLSQRVRSSILVLTFLAIRTALLNGEPGADSSAARGAGKSGTAGEGWLSSARWDLGVLFRPPEVFPAPGFEALGVRALFYSGLPWRGKPTRVFAWYGAPQEKSPQGGATESKPPGGAKPGARLPAMVLVHGGGGTAFEDWVRLWNERGYAAIAMDLCGATPGGTHDGRPRHEHGGPPGWGGFEQIDWAVEDQWAYHAIADILLAHSLLRSFDEVDPERIGITGISWGGYLTCIASTVDTRFRLAVPVYGCGFLGEDSCWLSAFRDMGEGKARKWLDLWDPSMFLGSSRMPMLWVTGTNDFAYPMGSLRKSYRLPQGERRLCVRVRMAHAHGGPGEKPEEIRAFADALLKGGPPLARITAQGEEGLRAWATFEASVPVVRAELNYTTNWGSWQGREWLTVTAKLDSTAAKATAEVPSDALAFYLNLIDERGLVTSTEHVERPPLNFVFLLLDDMRWDALGCAGNPIVKTPNIDRLAARGVAFRNMFCTTSICATSRATLLTGQYASRHGIHDFAASLSAEQLAETFPSILRSRGYRTGFIGKWGIGETLPRDAYDFFDGFPGQGFYFNNAKQGSREPEAAKEPKQSEEPGEPREHLTDYQGRKALEFLDGCDPSMPFCLQVSFKATHAQDGDPWPFQHAPRHADLYRDVAVAVPRTAAQTAFEALPGFLKTSEGRVRWEGRFSTPELYQKTAKDYYRLVTGVDDVVGMLLSKLEERGLADKTAIVLTSDNGFFLGEHGLSDKWFPYEESIRLPLIVFGPRLPSGRAGSKVDATALTIDIAPTILELAGLKAPERMQGRSLAPLLRGEPVVWRDDWFYEHRFEHPLIPKSEGVRGTRWKYVRFYGLPPGAGVAAGSKDGVYEQLFDVESDPLDERDLARNPAHAAALEEMRGKCDRWREKAR